MSPRGKLYDKIWKYISDNVDIIITHGPPKGILDISEDGNYKLEFCGCKELKRRIFEVHPKAHLFGHIHNMGNITNAGTMTIANYKTIFSNGSVITDRKFGSLSSNGNILSL